jgi:hypothetical protein
MYWIGKQGSDRLREVHGLVCNEQMLSMIYVEALAANRGTNHSFAKSQRLQNLQPRTAANAEWCYNNLSASYVGAHVRYKAGQYNAGKPAQFFDIAGWVGSNNGQGGVRNLLPDEGPDLVDEEKDRLSIGSVMKRAGEYNASRLLLDVKQRDIFARIDPIRNQAANIAILPARNGVSVSFGDSEYEICLPADSPLIALKFPEVQEIQCTSCVGAIVLACSQQNLTLYIVLIQHHRQVRRKAIVASK